MSLFFFWHQQELLIIIEQKDKLYENILDQFHRNNNKQLWQKKSFNDSIYAINNSTVCKVKWILIIFKYVLYVLLFSYTFLTTLLSRIIYIIHFI